ncbi:MAG: hypothetical protein GWN93_26925 [Deltaproteobacteria bacterium]|nr:hypothetical protein [Deltaproteobacteria bacterium]
MRPIKEGDMVTVIFSGEAYTGTAVLEGCIVAHMPSNTGDLLYFNHRGDTWAINPSSSQFLGIKLEG